MHLFTSLTAIVLVALLNIGIVSADVNPPLAASPPAPQHCNDLGPNVLDLVQHTNDALLSAVKAGFAADRLANSADYKTVEDQSNVVHESTLEAYYAMVPLQFSHLGGSKTVDAASQLMEQAQAELEVAQRLVFLALTYERTANTALVHHHKMLQSLGLFLIAPPLGAGYAAGASGATRSTNTTTTTGDVNGQAFTARSTTITTDYTAARALASAAAAAQQDRKESLEIYTPQVAVVVSQLQPVAMQWVAACKASLGQ